MEILVSGSLAYDRIMDFPGKFADHILPDKIHVLNVCFMVNGLKEKFGGTAGNIAYSLALLGEKPTILATAGRDFDRYESWLIQNGLPMTGVRHIEDEFTAGAYITTDQSDNQITGFNPGAMKYPSLYDLSGLDPAHTLAIISPGCLEDMMTYCRRFREIGVPYIFDPGQSITAFKGAELTEMLTGSAMLVTNDYELELICQSTGLKKSNLLERTGALITTLGEKGSIVSKNQEEVPIPAAKAAQVHDPTGAGDAYRAGLIKGLVLNKDLATAARMGATCASFSVEKYGTQEHRFTPEEFQARYQTNFG